MKYLPLLLLLGCHPIPSPNPPQADMTDAGPPLDLAGFKNEYGLDNCPTTLQVSFSDSCDTGEGAYFTSGGLACFHCTGAAGCYDVVDSVYCATGPAGCTTDPACVFTRNMPDVSAKKKSAHRVHPKNRAVKP